MGTMSDLHLLSGRVLDGESVAEVAQDSSYSEDDIRWAVKERMKYND